MEDQIEQGGVRILSIRLQMTKGGEGGISQASFARRDDTVQPVFAQFWRLGQKDCYGMLWRSVCIDGVVPELEAKGADLGGGDVVGDHGEGDIEGLEGQVGDL